MAVTTRGTVTFRRRQPIRSGRSAARQRACFGCRRSRVQISAPRPTQLAILLRVSREIRIVIAVLALLCATSFSLTTLPSTAAPRNSESAWYKVRKGDNLTVISRRFGVTVQDLRNDNGLRSDTIAIGQKLTMKRPFRRTSAKDITWARPLTRKGPVLHDFGPYKESGVIMPSTGVVMVYQLGGDLRAPANGVIRHVGEMEGFGTLVIIEHGAGYATVFAPLQPATINWQTDQAVHRGDLIGQTAGPVEGDQPYLHIELRKDDKAIKPDRLLK